MTTSSSGWSRIVSALLVNMAFPRRSMRNVRACDCPLLDRRKIPIDAEPGRSRRNGVTVFNRHPRRRDRIELRNVFDPRAVRHCGGERHVQFHQEMWTHGHVEGFGQMRDLEPRRDAADARAIDLDDRAGVAFKILPK